MYHHCTLGLRIWLCLENLGENLHVEGLFWGGRGFSRTALGHFTGGHVKPGNFEF